MTLFIFLSPIALGIGSGFLAGLLGIGGGMIITPFLSVLLTMQGVPAEYAMHAAIATSLSIILFTSMSSARAHNRNHFVLWNVFWGIAPGILVGAALGAQIASYLPTFWITLIFIIFVGFSAVKMFFDLKPKPTNTLPGKPGLFAVGTVIGGLSGIVGAGGGFISVPFIVRSNVEMHHAVGTSAALGFPIALAGTIGYIYAGWNLTGMPAWTAGYIHLPSLASVACATILTAPLGAAAAKRLNTKPLKKLFACLLMVLVFWMGSKIF